MQLLLSVRSSAEAQEQWFAAAQEKLGPAFIG